MKKLFVAFAALVSMALIACGPSKLEIQEMSANCDVFIEVRETLDDTLSLMVGNALYLNVKHVASNGLFPFPVSTRDPQELERETATDHVNSPEELLKYLRYSAPNMVNFGIVIGESAKNAIGFDEGKLVKELTEVFKKVDGGSLILFHENAGDIVSAKKIF